MHGRCLAVLLILFGAHRTHAASLTILPSSLSASGSQRFLRLSADGRTLIGVEGQDVFRWSPQEGRIVLGQIPSNTIITAASGDGGTIIGRVVENIGTRAFRWTSQDGVTLLPKLQGYNYNSTATHVTFDGSAVYGAGSSVFEQPVFDLIQLGLIQPPYDFPDIFTLGASARFHWNKDSGTQLFTDWTAPTYASHYNFVAISDNGQVIAGIRDSKPALWTADDGFVDPGPPESTYLVDMRDISGDGSAVIGMLRPRFNGPSSGGALHHIPFRWRPGGGYELLTEPLEYGDVHAVSTDGSTILGSIDDPEKGAYQFLWREGMGTEALAEVFADHGIVLPAGRLYAPEMSDTGLVFKGYSSETIQTGDGIHYLTTHWLVDLSSAVPEPGALFQVALAVTFAVLLPTRRRNLF